MQENSELLSSSKITNHGSQSIITVTQRLCDEQEKSHCLRNTYFHVALRSVRSHASHHCDFTRHNTYTYITNTWRNIVTNRISKTMSRLRQTATAPRKQCIGYGTHHLLMPFFTCHDGINTKVVRISCSDLLLASPMGIKMPKGRFRR